MRGCVSSPTHRLRRDSHWPGPGRDRQRAQSRAQARGARCEPTERLRRLILAGPGRDQLCPGPGRRAAVQHQVLAREPAPPGDAIAERVGAGPRRCGLAPLRGGRPWVDRVGWASGRVLPVCGVADVSRACVCARVCVLRARACVHARGHVCTATCICAISRE